VGSLMRCNRPVGPSGSGTTSNTHLWSRAQACQWSDRRDSRIPPHLGATLKEKEGGIIEWGAALPACIHRSSSIL
jgi:hypothetical protein